MVPYRRKRVGDTEITSATCPRRAEYGDPPQRPRGLEVDIDRAGSVGYCLTHVYPTLLRVGPERLPRMRATAAAALMRLET